MSRFNFCDCPAGFSAAPERHAPDCPGRSGAGKRSPTPVPATLKPAGEPKPYPDRLCHIDYTAHPHRCGCLSGDDEAQRRFDGCKRDTKLATAEGELARLTAERDALQLRLNAADQRIDELENKRAAPTGEREETQRFAIFNVLVSNCGQALTPDAVDRISAEIVTEMRGGPTAWAFST